MRAVLIFSLAIVMLPLSGCDIFIDNFGGEHMPCREHNDCEEGYECVQQTCVTVDSISGITHSIDGSGVIGSLAMSHVGDDKIWLATSTSVMSASTYVTQVWKVDSAGNIPLRKDLDTDGHQSMVSSMAFLEAKYELLSADSEGVQKWTSISTSPLMAEVSNEHDLLFGNTNGSWTLIVNQTNGNLRLVNGVGEVSIGAGTHTGDSVNTAAFNPTANRPAFVTAGKSILQWNCMNDPCSSLSDGGQPIAFDDYDITSIDYHPSGNFLAVVLDSTHSNELKILDLNMEYTDYWDGGESGYTTLAFSPDNNSWLAVGRYDGAIEIWDCETDSNCYVYRVFDNLGTAVENIAFSPNGQYLAASSEGMFVVYDLEQIFPTQ